MRRLLSRTAGLALGLIAGNFIFAAAFSHQWVRALDRSMFQSVAYLATLAVVADKDAPRG
jgi:hypothetical protein